MSAGLGRAQHPFLQGQCFQPSHSWSPFSDGHITPSQETLPVLSSHHMGNFSSQPPLGQVSPQISQHCQRHEREREIPLCPEQPSGDNWSWEAGESPWLDTVG